MTTTIRIWRSIDGRKPKLVEMRVDPPTESNSRQRRRWMTRKYGAPWA